MRSAKPAREAGFSFFGPEIRKVKEMKRVAIFGNAGGGKSTLAQALSEASGLPVYYADQLRYRPGGAQVPDAEFARIHGAILQRDAWIMEGFGTLKTTWAGLEAADTLIYIDLPLYRHAAWVVKRLLSAPWSRPTGWPEGASLLKGSLNSFRVLWLCHLHLTPVYRRFLVENGEGKELHHLRSPRQIRAFLGRLG